MSVDPTDATRITNALTTSAGHLLAYLERRSNDGDAADLLAETMTTAWRRVADLPEDAEQARMWLFGVARNVLANAHRSQQRRWRLANRLRLMLDPEPTQGADDGITVRDAVDRLPDDLRELVRLIHWDGFTIADAATLLEVNVSTARSRYARARELLADALRLDEPALKP